MNKEDTKNMIRRSPVVVVMGHIDHGKSTLLDYIRKSNVVAGEAGGITQHVGAYEAEFAGADGKIEKATFIDTPGHAAFIGIRERGARAADVAILVVSAEDGVKPQTVEAYKAIKKAGIPFVVAINKIDKPNANIEKTKTSLGENEIYVEGWGGDIPCVAISSVTGKGVPELLEMVVLVAELADLKADPEKEASGVVVESSLDAKKGISATLLVKNGTLTVGSFIVAGSMSAPVRFIEDFRGDKVESAGPSKPVRILGWNEAPEAGMEFISVSNKKKAEKIAEANRGKDQGSSRNAQTSQASPAIKKAADKMTPAEREAAASKIVLVPLVIKADVAGSLEGMKFELAKITHDKVDLNIVSEGVGDISESDVKLAESDPNLIIVGFNSEPDKKAATMIERSAAPLNIKTFKVIYDLVAFVRESLESKIPKEFIEETTGRAKVLALFSKDKDRQVVGGKVESGILESGNEVKIMRRDAEIGRGKIRELQSKKLRVQEVAQGFEFGTLVEAKVEIAQGDRIEAVRTVEK